MSRHLLIPWIAVIMLFIPACYKTSHEVVAEIKPIHITIDINIKVDKALDDFFGDIDKAGG